MFLATYTLVIVWINLCYVATYDAPTIWYVGTLGYWLTPFFPVVGTCHVVLLTERLGLAEENGFPDIMGFPR